jgi:hypothetical protein
MDITQTIINASTDSITEIENTDDMISDSVDELFEDEQETPQREVKKEILKQSIIEEKNKNDEMPVDEEGYYDPPENKSRHKSAEAEIQDRLLTVPRRPSFKIAPRGSLWIANTGFIEQVALLNITKSEQKSLLRQWADIQVLAAGDGNKDIVEEEQMEFMMKIVSYKSRSDNPEKGIRERTAHITQKSISDQTVVMPKSEGQKSGFLNTILGRKTQ